MGLYWNVTVFVYIYAFKETLNVPSVTFVAVANVGRLRQKWIGEYKILPDGLRNDEQVITKVL